MAIQKDKTLANGATGNYWKITNVTLDRVTRTAKWEIVLYFDSTHATARAPDLGLRKVFAAQVDITDSRSDLLALGYTTIKAQAAATVPNLIGGGTHTFDPDLVGGIDV